ncbi:MAG: 4-(cytidine 5'-diphospho)-2-C-methyl-D-erythritol kinase [Bacteroidales bacterium]|nr:4-(cytidine 5'-diphospho)-2-C-methyl-D-erythritol kinase [Bacteroidales bacterium]MBN2750658.1 4-(cytidine 5'-diphospho)-2-C-methyl-D-erythritol kinase [Bacteroidales bacterium]
MVLFPNAKVNIGLYIVNRRNDGFHDIETVFYPVQSLTDILEIVPAKDSEHELTFTQTGITVDGPWESNLCVKAYHLLKEHTRLPHVRIHLHKQIPMGAGLGGGSADGAFALKALNQLAANPVSHQQLLEIALKLGSDCPFFIENKPTFATGRGEVMQPIELDLSHYHVVLVNPQIHVNTGKAYSQSIPKPATTTLMQLSVQSIDTWKESVFNDFETVVFPLHPEVEAIKTELYRLGAVYAAMSGSGSTVFGIFKELPHTLNFNQDYFVHIG